jgi:hypothetical protein
MAEPENCSRLHIARVGKAVIMDSLGVVSKVTEPHEAPVVQLDRTTVS